MFKRRKMSRRHSRKNFSRGNRMHKRNSALMSISSLGMRGGPRF